MWKTNRKGEREFLGGQDDEANASLAAKECSNFIIDVEEEQVTAEPRSCYNCRYRRWTIETIVCCKR